MQGALLGPCFKTGPSPGPTLYAVPELGPLDTTPVAYRLSLDAEAPETK